MKCFNMATGFPKQVCLKKKKHFFSELNKFYLVLIDDKFMVTVENQFHTLFFSVAKFSNLSVVFHTSHV